ncbi:MAG TPA: acyl-CoA thioesterase [Clostridia bacterium]|nr:acyl-CoA thioesterase [Clostridia bacterium]
MAEIYRYTHRVTYRDCTVGNHIYYSRYLDLLEAARGEFFRSLSMPLAELQDQDTIFPVIECRVRYKLPARYDEVLTIEVAVAEAEGVRLTFRHRILNAAKALVAQAETFHVCTSLAEKPKRLPALLRENLQPWIANPE